MTIDTSTTAKPRLRWRKQPNERGLARVVQLPRGHDYTDGEKTIAYVRPSIDGYGGSRALKGWYWWASGDAGLPYVNTCNDLCATAEEAKKKAQSYVKEHLT